MLLSLEINYRYCYQLSVKQYGFTCEKTHKKKLNYSISIRIEMSFFLLENKYALITCIGKVTSKVYYVVLDFYHTWLDVSVFSKVFYFALK